MAEVQPIISFEDFTFRYKSQDEPTLKHINLDVFPGEKVLILGPSGSGKSTLAKAINGLILDKDNGGFTGDVVVNGESLNDATVFSRSSTIGTVLQDSNSQFVGLSVGEDIAFYLENLNTPLPEMKEKVASSAKIIGMHNLLKRLPFSLSGGQKQRVTVGGVLNGDAPVILLDEPLAALNPKMSNQMIELLDNLNKKNNKTIVIVEHRLEEVLHRNIDKIVLVADGEIVTVATSDELLKTDLLEKYGIRRPLYLECLERLGKVETNSRNIWNVDRIDLTGYQDKLRQLVAKPSTEQSNADYSNKENLIEINNLRFSYDNQPFVHIDNLQINRGEKISLIGKNGAGKSTFAQLLCGVLKPQLGTINELGNDIEKQSIQEVGQQVGYIIQDPDKMIVEDTVIDEVALALKLHGFASEEIKLRVDKALKVTDLYSMRNWPVDALSFGQKKRLTIASMLVIKPAVLILDEPTAGQDFRHYKQMMDFVNQLVSQNDMAMIVITHDMQLALDYTDRTIVIDNGGVISDKDPYATLADKELLTRTGLVQTSIYKLADRVGVSGEKLARTVSI
ncbi:ABC transporter ATP-binding protein [Lentilactobacillus sp. SPB1-3]|uniref:ABC transporter ATP-binding protein n=1 Tax=Lentilactobacillus terminaliae TaxID=3003483 RepID=A0ACD5DEW2_9LACO|nr:DUF3744 domain-containing protein [Lentilactobacillus sp. SPB1-3]MCZ0976459.1 DUF3744 domain-containing protein [Lentilactobacillus sp. SPB1-3]